jgi:phage tail-like protein
MTAPELQRVTFRTASQWAHGLSYRLRQFDDGGVALFSRPAFSGWVTRDATARGASSLAIDECGRTFWIEQERGWLYRRDPVNDLIEPVTSLVGGDDGERHVFPRMLTAAGRLWILDGTGSRLITLRPDTFQIISEIPLGQPIDFALHHGRMFVLSADGIRMFDLDGRSLGGPYRGPLSRPVAIGAGRDSQGASWVYVIDHSVRGFLRYSAATGEFDSVLGSFDDVVADAPFVPRMLLVHPEGDLFATDGSAIAHEFAADGGYVGPTGDVTPLSAITGLAVSASGDLYLAAPEGIARLSPEAGVAGNDGFFYSRTLDNGTDRDEGWHRVDLSAELDGGGALDVYYASSGNAGLAAAVDGIVERSASSAAKVTSLETVLGDMWKGPHQLRGVAPPGAATAALQGFARHLSHSVAFGDGTARYLWLKLKLAGLSPKATASVREMRVYYPRLSLLRYLPAVYQHDKVSKEFLDRFLAMFETVTSGLEATIERSQEVFDPDRTPGEFLDWLAQWLDLGIEEDWPPPVKRRLIQNASRLYQRKGTPGGLAEFIEVVTGRRPIIREAFATERPLVLGSHVVLGVGSRIRQRPEASLPAEQRTVLGHSSRLGSTAIRATTKVAVDPFRFAASRFTVLLDLPPARYQRYARGLHRIIRENAPAHLAYDIRLVPRGLSGRAILGVNVTLADAPRMLLGHTALGTAVCTRPVWYGPQVGVDLTLAGPHGASPHTPAFPDGEQ